MCMKIIPAQHFSFDLVHSLSGINLGFYLYSSLFLGGGGGGGGGGEKLDFFTLWGGGGSCTVSWEGLGGSSSVWGGGGGGSFPCAPHPLGLIPYVSSLEQL